eukprot:s366_g67.t1
MKFEEGHQQRPSNNELFMYTDISYAPPHEDFRSVEGVTGQWMGKTLLWDSSRQPYVSLSTAEAELTGYTSGFQAGESLSALMECLGIPIDCKILHGDNKAALSATSTESGPWRTRHLRIRAHGLREAVRQQLWQAKHLPGTVLVADGLTKILMGVAFANFRNRLGVMGKDKKSNTEMDFHTAVTNVKVLEEFVAAKNTKVFAEQDVLTNVKVFDESAVFVNDTIPDKFEVTANALQILPVSMSKLLTLTRQSRLSRPIPMVKHFDGKLKVSLGGMNGAI